MGINKKEMRNRVARGVDASPSMADRLAHARGLADSNPAHVTPQIFPGAGDPRIDPVPTTVTTQSKAEPAEASQQPTRATAAATAMPTGNGGSHGAVRDRIEPVSAPMKPLGAPGASTTVDSSPGNLLNAPGPSGVVDSGRKILRVPIALTEDNPLNARHLYVQSRINEISASLKKHGQETPAPATLRAGRYTLAGGHYRKRGLIQNGETMIDIIDVGPLTDQQLYEMSYRENCEREEQSALDNAYAWRKLLDEKVYATDAELAASLGLSKGTVSKTLKSLSISPEVMDLINEAPASFALTVLYELALFEPLGGIKRTKELVQQVVKDEIGRKEIQHARSLLEDAPTRSRRKTSQQYQLHYGASAVGLLKEWETGKLEIEIEISDPVARASLVESLKAIFQESRQKQS